MEYMEVLNKIIEAERAAQLIAGEAKAARDNLPNDLRARREEVHSKYLARAEQRVLVVREQEESMADQQITQLEAELRDDLLSLESYFGTHRDEMVDRLFGLVIGV